jgi:hypothetical protein
MAGCGQLGGRGAAGERAGGDGAAVGERDDASASGLAGGTLGQLRF